MVELGLLQSESSMYHFLLSAIAAVCDGADSEINVKKST